MTEYGLEPLGMFELTPVGLPILAIGLIYMFFIGIRIIPVRETVIEEFSDFRVTTYLTETVILPESPLVGKTLGDSGLGRDLDLTVLRIVRGERDYLAPRSDLKLLGGDVLVVEGHKDEILKIRQTAGIDIKADVKLSDPSLQTGDYRLVEAVLLPKSPLVGRTLKGLSFRERFGLQVLAINRHGETIHHKISEARLQLGDILLLQGNQSNIRALQEDNTFRILGWIDRKAPNQRRAPLAIAGFAGALFLGTIELVPLTVAVFLGVLFVFLTRCITPEEAYREVEWRALILIGCMLGVGGALEYTGAAEYLASVIVRIVGTSNPIYLLGGFFILTLLLTQPMSNQAAAAVILPIAIQTATQLNLNPRAFAVMIAVAASCSFLTPLEPACLLVYGPGNYRFFDFIKVGSILSLIIFMLALLLVPAFWPLAL
jgi:di/tricarboxylate transporter